MSSICKRVPHNHLVFVSLSITAILRSCFYLININGCNYMAFNCLRTDWNTMHGQKYVLVRHLISKPLASIYPFVAGTTNTLLGKFSTWCWNMDAGICSHSFIHKIVSEAPMLGNGAGQCSSSQRCSVGSRSVFLSVNLSIYVQYIDFNNLF